MKWNKASEKLPKKSGYYLTIHGEVSQVLHFAKEFGLFNAFDGEASHEYALPADYWMPIPKVPKEGGETVEAV